MKLWYNLKNEGWKSKESEDYHDGMTALDPSIDFPITGTTGGSGGNL